MKITFCVLRLSLLGLLAQVDANQGTKNLYGGYCRSRIHPDQRRFVCIESDDGPLDLEEGSVSSWYYLDPSDATRKSPLPSSSPAQEDCIMIRVLKPPPGFRYGRRFRQ